MAVLIGTSGWQYDHWRDVLYEGVPRSRWLERYAASFPAVEVNNTFYNLPGEKTFGDWAARTPDGFVFALKASRLITHVRRLRGAEEAVGRFLERASLLGPKLGPVLYQLPPSMRRDEERLAAFLEVLPRHPPAALEFRHDSWYAEAVLGLLRAHGVALCVADSPVHRTPLALTAGWAYVRLHGGDPGPGYGGWALATWARRVADLARRADPVYVFFNNDTAGWAVRDARRLAERVAAFGAAVAAPPGARSGVC
jgi:uncharacterized protein YecE (DUF72 family)